MPRSRRCPMLVTALTLTAWPLSAQAPAAVLDTTFARWASTHGPGCTVGVDFAGTRTTRAYGMANLEYGVDLVQHQQRLNFAPGSEYLYSNTGYALAAIIVQRVSGKSLADFSRDELFTPLGMTRTEWRADYRKVVPDRATAYSQTSGGWLQDMPFTNVHGNGGLLTTVDDLLRWNEALTKGTIPGGAALVAPPGIALHRHFADWRDPLAWNRLPGRAPAKYGLA